MVFLSKIYTSTILSYAEVPQPSKSRSGVAELGYAERLYGERLRNLCIGEYFNMILDKEPNKEL